MKGKILAILIALSCTITSNVIAQITIEGEAPAYVYYIYPENGAYINSFDGFTIFHTINAGYLDYKEYKDIVITNGIEEIPMTFDYYEFISSSRYEEMHQYALRLVPEKELSPGDWTLVIPSETIYFRFYPKGGKSVKYSWLEETHITIHVGKKLSAKCIYDVETESPKNIYEIDNDSKRSIVLPAKIRLNIKGLQLIDENGETSFEEIKTIDLNPKITPCECLTRKIADRYDGFYLSYYYSSPEFVFNEKQSSLETIAFSEIDSSYIGLWYSFEKGTININGYDVEPISFRFNIEFLDDISNIKFEKPEFLISGNSISISEYNGMPWAIYDLTGRCVYRGTSENVELSSGIYIVSSDYFTPQKICIP